MTDISPAPNSTPTPASPATPDPAPAPTPSLVGGAGLDSAPGGGDTTPAPGGDTSPGDATSPGDSTEPGTGADTAVGDSTEPAAPELTLDSYTFTYPEGFTPDDALLAKFKEQSLADKLDPTTAQKYVDLYVESQTALATRIQTDYQDVQAGWLREIEATPDFNTAARKEASIATMGRYLDEYGTPEVRAALDSSGMGNNPHFVALLLKTAKALTEGGPTRSGLPAAQRRNLSPGQTLYGDKYDAPRPQ